MAKCVIEHNGYLITSPVGCDYMILTSEEVQQLTGAETGNLTIHSELYSEVTGYLLLSFISGHVLGRIVKTLGRR